MKRLLYTILLIVSFGALAQDAVVQYTFSGNAFDGGSNSNNGTVNGATLTADRFNAANSAYLFDGVDDNISIADASYLDIGTSDFTLSFWMNTSNATEQMRIISKGSVGGQVGYQVRTDIGKVYVEMNGGQVGISTSTVADGTWHMVTVVLDRDTDVRIYVDGILDGSQAVNTSAIDLTNAETLTIGSNPLPGEFFDGSLDQIRIYDQVLSASQVETFYEDDLILAAYGFSDGNATDFTGNEHHGTVTGASQTTDRFEVASNAFFFGGSSDITLANTANVDFEDEITVTAWIKASVYEADGAGEPQFISNGGSSTGFDFKLSGGTSTEKGLKAEIFGTGVFLVAGSLGLDTWYHVAFSYERNGSMILYVNGQEIGNTAAVDQPIAVSANSLVMGDFLNGSIDELTIYDRALSAGEIESVFSATIEAEPADQPTNMVFANNSGACFSYDFTASTTTNITGYLHVFRAIEAPDFVPQDGVTYTADVGTPISGDNFIASVGNSTSGNLCSQPNTTYFYDIYAYNGSGATINYLTENPLSAQITTNGDPTITSFTPTMGNEGDLLTITGTNFSETLGNNEVTVGGKVATVDGTPTNESITVFVPDNATSGPVSVRVGVGLVTGSHLTATSSEDFIREDPHVLLTFTGNLLDDSGNGNNGSASGGATLAPDRLGNANSAFSFDGVDGAVITNDLTVQPTQLTMSAWFFFDTGAADGTHQMMEIPGAAALALFEGEFQGVLNLGGNFVTLSAPVTSGEWHFGAMTYDGTTFRTYLDGQLVQEFANTDQVEYLNSTSLLHVGVDQFTMSNYFNGSLDDVQVHGRALSAGEISGIYSEGTLVAQYNFDGGTATDITGNGYDGTTFGAEIQFSVDRFGSGQAFEPENDGDYIQINHNGTWDMQGKVTLNGWIRPNSLPLDTEFGEVIFSDDAFGQFDVAPGGGVFYHWNQNESGNFGTLVTDVGAIQENQWSMISLVITGSDYVKIYVNGERQKVSLIGGAQNADSIQITRHAGIANFAEFGDKTSAGNGPRWFDGSIDDFRVYLGRELSSSEIANIYQNELSGGLDELVAYYPFDDGSLSDFSGNSFGGVFRNEGGTEIATATTVDRLGNANGALVFDNTGNNTLIFHERSINIGRDFTVNMWIRPRSFSSVTELGDVLISDDSGGRFMTLNDGSLSYHYNATDGSFLFVTSAANILELDQWQMVTYSITNGYDIKLYLNGAVVASGNVDDHAFNLSAQIVLAQADKVDESGTQDRFYDGAMDEVSVFQRVLSDQDVADLFTVNTFIADYTFTGNANDESGNGNDATINGASLTVDRFGNPENAFAFDGVDDYLTRTDANFLNGLNEGTISLWFNTGSTTKIQDILNTGSSRISITDNGLVITELFTDGMDASMGTSILADTWTHVVLTYDGSMARLYQNATLAVENASDGLINDAGSMFIGSNSGTSNFMDGEIDDIKILNRALSQAEVTALFNEGGSKANDIISFSIPDQVDAVINVNDHTVSVDMPFGTDRSALVPTIEVSDQASINPASGVAQDFSDVVIYTVTAEDGSTQDWQVFLSVLANTESAFTSFSVDGNEAAIDPDFLTITGEVAFGTDEAALIAVFELSDGATATIDGNVQTSNSTVNNFTTPKTYRVTAADGVTFTDWVVTITVAAEGAAEFLAYDIAEQEGDTDLNSTNGTINLNVTSGTVVTNLIAGFTLSGGASAEVGGTPQVGGQTENDFTNPVEYVVTAADNTTTKTWTVTVGFVASAATDITAFAISDQVGDAVIDVDNHTVEVSMPFGTNAAALTPSFIELSVGATISPDASAGRDFTVPQTYTVTAEDGVTTQDWSVAVIVLPNSAPTSLELDNNSVPENQAIGTLVGRFATTDPDGQTSFTYDLVSGTGDTNNNDFAIVGDELQTAEILSIADGTSRSILVRTDDGANGQLLEIFEITVTESQNVDSEFSFTRISSQPEVGQPFDINITVTDVQGVDQVSIYHWPAGEAPSTDPQSMNNDGGGDVYTYSMADGSLNDQGVQYFMRATDGVGNTADSDIFFTSKTVSSTSDNLPSIAAGTTVEAYKIVAFPYQSLSISALEDDLGTYNSENWRLLNYTGSSASPYRDLTSGSSTSGGVGYWFLSKEQATITVGGSSVELNERNAFVINLTSGFNLIGNPFKSAINWDDVITHNIDNLIIVANDVTSPAGYNGGYTTRDRLNAYEGAFVSSNGSIAFEIPLSAIGGRVGEDVGSTTMEAFIDNAEWDLRFFFETPSYSYKMGSIGMNEQALDGSDKFDFPLLPKFSTYLEQVFADGNTQSVKQSDHFKEWTFQVPNNLPESAINMTWDIPVSSRKTILLVDGASNKVYDLSKTRSINLPNNPSATHRIYYGDAATIWDNIDLPFDVLYSIYPNPVDNQFTLEVYVAENKNVEVELISLSGQSISLGQISLQRGLSSRRMDVSKPEVKNGIYFVKVDGKVMSKIFKK